jgi:hypothetical protein
MRYMRYTALPPLSHKHLRTDNLSVDPVRNWYAPGTVRYAPLSKP